MGKHFRMDHLDQGLLFPPSLHHWLPEGHLARFIVGVIEKYWKYWVSLNLPLFDSPKRRQS